MKAWQCGESTNIDDLELSFQPAPEGDVVIRVVAAAVNFSDILMVRDEYQIKPPRPFIPGQEVAGTVISAPADSGFAVDDRVATKVNWGGFAETVSVPANMPIRIPDALPFATAAALPVSYTTAMVGLTECTTLVPGDWVLVHAASGAVGLAAVEIATALGARVIATASSVKKRALAAAHGADITVDYTAEGWAKEVKQTTGGGAQVVFDPVGGDIGEQSLRAIARDGTLLVVGFAAGRIPKFPGHLLLLKRAAAKGVYWNHDEDPQMMARVTTRIMDMLSKGQLNPEVRTYEGLAALPTALADLGERRSIGKLVLDLEAEKCLNP